MTPLRIQLSRKRGWRMPPDTVKVSRPGRFGNHFVVWCDDDDQWTVSWRGCHYTPAENTKLSAQAKAVELYRADVYPDGPQHHRGIDPPPTQNDVIKYLRGRNAACWCRLCPTHKDGKPLGVTCTECEPCHADVLLELANPNIIAKAIEAERQR